MLGARRMPIKDIPTNECAGEGSPFSSIMAAHEGAGYGLEYRTGTRVGISRDSYAMGNGVPRLLSIGLPDAGDG
jgi:hypothetical protein